MIGLLKSRNVALLSAADAISVLGDQCGWIALLWLAMVTTHHSGEMGLVGLVFGLPSVGLGAVVGSILDRYSNKTILLVANGLLGLLFITIAALSHLNALPFFGLLSLVFLAGCLTPFTSVGWMIMVPKLVRESELGQANALVETIWNGAMLLGPLLGGVLISTFGAELAIFLDGLSFWCAAMCVFFIKDQHLVDGAQLPQKEDRSHSFLKEVWEGVRLLVQLKPVWWITLSALVINLVYGGLEVSLPLFTNRELKESAFILGTFWTTYFISSLVGSYCSGLGIKRFKTGRLLMLMILGWGMSLILFLGWHSIGVTYGIMALAGFLFGGYPPLARTSVQLIVPKNLQGRIFGIRSSILTLGLPVGSFMSGLAGHWMRPSIWMGCMGIGIVALGLVIAFYKPFRDLP